MTTVRITVDHPFLGQVDVEESDQISRFDPAKERAAIERLLQAALGKIRRAYEITAEESA